MLAKEKGFPLRKVIKQDGRAFFYELPQSHPDWANCDAWYLPTQSLLQRWLREEKKIHINICAAYGWDIERTDGNILLPHNNLDYICTHLRSSDVTWEDNYGYFDTYELALEDALKYALENLI